MVTVVKGAHQDTDHLKPFLSFVKGFPYTTALQMRSRKQPLVGAINKAAGRFYTDPLPKQKLFGSALLGIMELDRCI